MTNTAKRQPGSHIITVLETAWAAIQAHHPDVPDVVAITGGGSGADLTMGHFSFARWKPAAGGTALSELFISGEVIGVGGRTVMETLLHEAVHGMAETRGIQDTSRQNRYHNENFSRLARKVGLKPPPVKDDTYGWSECTITNATATKYQDMIEAIDAANLPYRASPWVAIMQTEQEIAEEIAKLEETMGELVNAGPGLVTGQPPVPALPTGRDGVRIAVACSCTPPRRMQGSPASIERGPIICGACGEEFVIAEPQRRRPRRARAR